MTDAVGAVAKTDGEDTHDILLAEQGDRDIGWCDCDGFNFHTKQGKGPCAHLCTLGKLTVFDEIPVPPVDELGTPVDVDDRDQDDVVDGDRDADLPQAGAGEIVVPEREQPELTIDGAALDDPLETLPDWMKTEVD